MTHERVTSAHAASQARARSSGARSSTGSAAIPSKMRRSSGSASSRQYARVTGMRDRTVSTQRASEAASSSSETLGRNENYAHPGHTPGYSRCGAPNVS